MYQQAIANLEKNLKRINKSTPNKNLTLGVARKKGLSQAFKQFEKDLNKATQKEISKLSKEMQDAYLKSYANTTGISRKPRKKAKDKANYPWSGMNYKQRLMKNSLDLNLQMKTNIERSLRKGCSVGDLLNLTSFIEDKFNDRQMILKRTEVWHMDLLGSYDGMKYKKVKFVQYATMGDRKVCPECRSLEEYNEGIYPIEEAPVLPRHPHCRCVLLEYNM